MIARENPRFLQGVAALSQAFERGLFSTERKEIIYLRRRITPSSRAGEVIVLDDYPLDDVLGLLKRSPPLRPSHHTIPHVPTRYLKSLRPSLVDIAVFQGLHPFTMQLGTTKQTRNEDQALQQAGIRGIQVPVVVVGSQ